MYRLLLISLTLALVYAYPQGPPVDQVPDLCTHMLPTLHGGQPQTVQPPFEILLSQNCYKENSEIEVRIQITDKAWYFEGYFIQARKGEDNKMSYGTFNTKAQEGVQTLTCFEKAHSALGQSEKKHYWTRTFKWTAPSSNVGALHFRATLVKNQLTYWVGVKSQEINYNANCSASSTLPAGVYQDIQEGWVDGSEGPTSACASYVINVYIAFTMVLAALMFVRK